LPLSKRYRTSVVLSWAHAQAAEYTLTGGTTANGVNGCATIRKDTKSIQILLYMLLGLASLPEFPSTRFFELNNDSFSPVLGIRRQGQEIGRACTSEATCTMVNLLGRWIVPGGRSSGNGSGVYLGQYAKRVEWRTGQRIRRN
jgi:hypothetical protein